MHQQLSLLLAQDVLCQRLSVVMQHGPERMWRCCLVAAPLVVTALQLVTVTLVLAQMSHALQLCA